MTDAAQPAPYRFKPSESRFYCRECFAQTTTERGMHLHLSVAHGLNYVGPTIERMAKEPNPVESGDLPKGIGPRGRQ